MRIPRTIDEITPAWLTAALREKGTIIGATVENIAIQEIGVGQGLGEGIKHISITYERPEGTGPSTLVAKMAPTNDVKRKNSDDFGIFEREVRFYQEFAAIVGTRTPLCYFAEYDPDTGYFILLLEDLSYLREVDQADDCSLQDAGLSLRALVELHSKWWANSDIQKLPWVINPADPKYSSSSQDRYLKNTVGLVRNDHHPLGGAPQHVGDVLVERQQTGARVDDEQHQRSVLDHP